MTFLSFNHLPDLEKYIADNAITANIIVFVGWAENRWVLIHS